MADAVEWYEHLISVGVSSSTIFVAGDSAGGFLGTALVVCVRVYGALVARILPHNVSSACGWPARA